MTYIGEFIGMTFLILLNDGVIANVKLNGSGMKHDSSILHICIGSGLAVYIPLCLFIHYSGAHFNPAVTIALSLTGQFPVGKVIPYLLCQFSGAFTGACIVWLLYRDQFKLTEDGDVKRSVFCTSPAIRHYTSNFLSEMTGTFILVFTIISISKSNLSEHAGILIFATVTAIGMSLGGLTGFAINPARDLGPRIAHSLLPIRNRKNDWKYSWIPVAGPIAGAMAASALYIALPW